MLTDLQVATEGSVVQGGTSGPIGYINVAEQWNQGLSAPDRLVSGGHMQRGLPVLISSVHISRVF